METAFDSALDALEDLTHELDYAVAGPRDNRVHEIRTTQFPFNTICYLGRDLGDGLSRGCTGVLIAPRAVLTAGHCVYSHKLRRPPTRIAVIPGRADRDTMPYGSIVSRRYFAPRNFIHPRPGTTDRRDFDFGLIILPRPFSKLPRFMEARALSDENLKRLKQLRLVTITGYPGDRPVGTQWRHTERLKKITPRRLFYTIDTCPGHSGSPIWYRPDKGQKPVIIGVHTSGIVDERGRTYGCKRGTVLAPPGMMNSGVRLTLKVLANIRGIPKAADMVRLP